MLRHIDIASCQSRRFPLLSERLHRAIINLQEGRFRDKVHLLGVNVLLIFFGRPQQIVVDFTDICRCHAMRNCLSKVGQMEGIVLDRQARIAPLLWLMSINIATSDVSRTHIITLLPRILKHSSVTGDDLLLDFLSWHLRMFHHGVSTNTADRIRGGAV